jgi:hypothetical protein
VISEPIDEHKGELLSPAPLSIPTPPLFLISDFALRADFVILLGRGRRKNKNKNKVFDGDCDFCF